MFLNITILIISTFAFLFWLAALIFYTNKYTKLKEENKALKAKIELNNCQKNLYFIQEAVKFLQENNIEPAFNGMYSKEQLQTTPIFKSNKNKTPDGGNE